MIRCLLALIVLASVPVQAQRVPLPRLASGPDPVADLLLLDRDTVWIDPYSREEYSSPEAHAARQPEVIYPMRVASPSELIKASRLQTANGWLEAKSVRVATKWGYDRPYGVSVTRCEVAEYPVLAQEALYSAFNPAYQCSTGGYAAAPPPPCLTFIALARPYTADSLRAWSQRWSGVTQGSLGGRPAWSSGNDKIAVLTPRLVVEIHQRDAAFADSLLAEFAPPTLSERDVIADDQGQFLEGIVGASDGRLRIQERRYRLQTLTTQIPNGWAYTDMMAASCRHRSSGYVLAAERGPLDPCRTGPVVRGEHGLAVAVRKGERPDALLRDYLNLDQLLSTQEWQWLSVVPVDVEGSPAAVFMTYAHDELGQRMWVVNWIREGVEADAVAVFGPPEREPEALDLLWRTVRATSWEPL